jgi:predicted TIM-barrel fold metal-dependent hydrolase
MTINQDRYDTHTHVWYGEKLNSKWHAAQSAQKKRKGSAEALIDLMAANSIIKSVIITPTTLGFDNKITLDLFANYPDKFIPVVRPNLDSLYLRDDLKQLIELGGKGVRISLLKYQDLDFLWEYEKSSFWNLLVSSGIPVMFHCHAHQAWALRKIAEEYPPLKIAIDHFGRVNVDEGSDSRDFRDILSLSDLSNVNIKCSSSNYFSKVPVSHIDLSEYMQKILESFTPQRVFWGSDWPLCEEQGSYYDSFEPLLSMGLPNQNEIQELIFKTNVERFFDLV